MGRVVLDAVPAWYSISPSFELGHPLRLRVQRPAWKRREEGFGPFGRDLQAQEDASFPPDGNLGLVILDYGRARILGAGESFSSGASVRWALPFVGGTGIGGDGNRLFLPVFASGLRLPGSPSDQDHRTLLPFLANPHFLFPRAPPRCNQGVRRVFRRSPMLISLAATKYT